MDGQLGGSAVLPRVRAFPLRCLIAVGAGLATGSFAAWAYYDDTFRPLAHSFSLWILTVALLSARQRRRHAIAASFLALALAVVAFYVGKQVMYGLDYPGMPYSINAADLVEWLVLAVVAAVLLGGVFAPIGTPGHAGSIGTAIAVGLLVGDAWRRTWFGPAGAWVLIGFAVLAIAAVLIVAVRSGRQLLPIAGWSAPASVLAVALVSAPDALEQVLVTGHL